MNNKRYQVYKEVLGRTFIVNHSVLAIKIIVLYLLYPKLKYLKEKGLLKIMSTYSRKQTEIWQPKHSDCGKSANGASKASSGKASHSYANKYEGMSKNIEEVRGTVIPGYRSRG